MTMNDRWKYFEQYVADSDSPFAIFGGDAMKCLARLPDESIDMVCTDFPYESLEKHRKRGTTTRLKHSKSSSNDWFKIFPNELIHGLLLELFRVMAPDSHCYLFCDDETSNLIRDVVAMTNVEHDKGQSFKWWKRIVWDKDRRGMGYHYATQYEFVIFLEKGKRKLNDLGPTDVQRFKRVSKKSLGRKPKPTEKPVDLLKVFVMNSSNEGDLILDPFMGSGSCGAAAVENGRQFLGFELKPSAVRFARNRLRDSMVVARLRASR